MTTIPTAQLFTPVKTKTVDDGLQLPVAADLFALPLIIDTDRLEDNGWILVDEETQQIAVFAFDDPHGNNLPIALYEATTAEIESWQTSDSTDIVIVGTLPVSAYIEN